MPAIRITFNTDKHGDDVEAARKDVAEKLLELAELLATGEYVGRFALGSKQLDEQLFGGVDEL